MSDYLHTVEAFDVAPGVRRVNISFFTRINDGNRIQLFMKWAVEALVKVDRIVSTLKRADVNEKLKAVAQTNGTQHKEVAP